MQDEFGCGLGGVKMSCDEGGGRNPTSERDLLGVVDPAAELKVLFLRNSGFGWIVRDETDLCSQEVTGKGRLGDFFEDGRESLQRANLNDEWIGPALGRNGVGHGPVSFGDLFQ